MDLKKLTPQNLSVRTKKGIPTVSFTRRGIVILSKRSVEKLSINLSSVNGDNRIDLFEDTTLGEFFISKGTTYCLRLNGKGGGVFNCRALCDLVMERTWRLQPHIVSDQVPPRFTFVICERPVDEEEKKNIFALLRKKI